MTDLEQELLVGSARKYWNIRGVSSSPNNSISNNNSASSPWPFDIKTNLPKCGCVRSGDNDSKIQKTKTGKDIGGVGDVRNNERALRKELQLANMIQCVLALLPDHVRNPTSVTNSDNCNGDVQRKYRIVDFAGGTGHLAVPLALLLPHCEVVCVDLKKWSLDLLHQRVDGPFNLPEKGGEGRKQLATAWK